MRENENQGVISSSEVSKLSFYGGSYNFYMVITKNKVLLPFLQEYPPGSFAGVAVN